MKVREIVKGVLSGVSVLDIAVELHETPANVQLIQEVVNTVQKEMRNANKRQADPR